MSGFAGAVPLAPGIVVIPRTCDGLGAWECGNMLQAGENVCTECADFICGCSEGGDEA